MLVGWRYIISTFMSLKWNFSMFTPSFRKETFRSKSPIGSFSRIGLDQIHEQNNKLIKGCGGASDLLSKVDDSALILFF